MGVDELRNLGDRPHAAAKLIRSVSCSSVCLVDISAFGPTMSNEMNSLKLPFDSADW